MPKLFYINSSISNHSVYTQLIVKSVPFQTIPFSIDTQFSSISLKDRTLINATTSGQNGPGSDSNKGVLHIPQSSSITGASPLDCFWVLSLSSDTLGVLNTPSWLGEKVCRHVEIIKRCWKETNFWR